MPADVTAQAVIDHIKDPLIAELNGRREDILAKLPFLARALVRDRWGVLEDEILHMLHFGLAKLLADYGPTTLEDAVAAAIAGKITKTGR